MKRLKEKNVCVSDVDGTLLHGSLILQHACFLEKNSMINTNGVAKEWLEDVKNEKLIVGLAEVYISEIIGKKEEDLLIEEFFAHLLDSDTNFIHDIIDLMTEDYVDAVLLLSGSPMFLVKELGQLIEDYISKPVVSIGSEYELKDEIFTGKIINPMFTAQAKENVLNGSDFESNITLGLGDTASDFPILQRAKKSILVNPTEHTQSKCNIKHVEIFKSV